MVQVKKRARFGSCNKGDGDWCSVEGTSEALYWLVEVMERSTLLNFKMPNFEDFQSEKKELYFIYLLLLCFNVIYYQETSRNGFLWWLKLSLRAPENAQPPGTTADRTNMPASLQTPGMTFKVSLGCHNSEPWLCCGCSRKLSSMCAFLFIESY